MVLGSHTVRNWSTVQDWGNVLDVYTALRLSFVLNAGPYLGVVPGR